MKINNKKRIIKYFKINRLKVLLFVLSLLFIAAFFFTLEKLQITNFIKSPNNIAPSQDINIDENQNNNTPPTQEQNDTSTIDKEKNTTVKPSAVTISIVSILSDADYLHIKSVINGAISNSGECKLTLTKNDSSVIIEKTVKTYALPSSSTCMGFDVSRSELTNGLWTASIRISINTEISTVTKEFSLE